MAPRNPTDVSAVSIGARDHAPMNERAAGAAPVVDGIMDETGDNLLTEDGLVLLPE